MNNLDAETAELQLMQMMTDESGKPNSSFPLSENANHTIGEMIDPEKLAHFALPFEIPTLHVLQATTSEQIVKLGNEAGELVEYTWQHCDNNDKKIEYFAHIAGQLENNKVANFLHWSQARSHITGINIRKDEHGFLHAKIADSLQNDPAEYQMALDAIKQNNEKARAKAITSLSNIADGQGFNAEQESLFNAVAEYKPINYVTHVANHKQTVVNSCGFHSVVNLYALSQGPHATNVSQFGTTLEGILKQQKNQSSSLDTMGNLVRTSLDGGVQP